MLRLPSVRNIHRSVPNATWGDSIVIRRMLEQYRKRHPLGTARPVATFTKIAKLLAAECDEVPPGTNKKSPEVYYIKGDDTYDQTLLWTPGKIFVGNIGHQIEQGNYA